MTQPVSNVQSAYLGAASCVQVTDSAQDLASQMEILKVLRELRMKYGHTYMDSISETTEMLDPGPGYTIKQGRKLSFL